MTTLAREYCSGFRKLRIWHIAETYPPEYGGGAAVYVRDICRGLSARGHEVRVLCTEHREGPAYRVQTDYDGAIRVDRINLPYYKAHDPDGWRVGFLRWLRHERRASDLVGRICSEWGPDLVHYSATRPLGEGAVVAIAKSGVPIVGFLHEAWLICPRLMLLSSPRSLPCSGPGPARCLLCMYSHYDGTMLRAGLKLGWRAAKLGIYPAYRIWRRSQVRRRLRGALAYSHFMASAHQEHIPGCVRFVPLGINLLSLPASRPQRPRSPLRFGFVAGFQLTKGIWHVLDAVSALRRDGFAFELHVWGPGQEDGAAVVRSRQLEEIVKLHGMYTPERLWEVYTEIDVAIMATTVCEPLGRVVQEAAAVGAPTIGPAVGGIAEQIRHDVDGLLFRFNDPVDLERQMRRALEEPNLVARLAANLRPVPDTRQAILDVEQFYYDVLGIADSSRAAQAAEQLPIVS